MMVVMMNIIIMMMTVVMLVTTIVILLFLRLTLLGCGHTEHSARDVRYVCYARENSCLYRQRKGPHKTAYAMYAMLAM